MDTRFGEFRFDTATRQIFRADVELPLSPEGVRVAEVADRAPAPRPFQIGTAATALARHVRL